MLFFLENFNMHKKKLNLRYNIEFNKKNEKIFIFKRKYIY